MRHEIIQHNKFSLNKICVDRKPGVRRRDYVKNL